VNPVFKPPSYRVTEDRPQAFATLPFVLFLFMIGLLAACGCDRRRAESSNLRKQKMALVKNMAQDIAAEIKNTPDHELKQANFPRAIGNRPLDGSGFLFVLDMKTKKVLVGFPRGYPPSIERDMNGILRILPPEHAAGIMETMTASGTRYDIKYGTVPDSRIDWRVLYIEKR
jgi:hypothetical protein